MASWPLGQSLGMCLVSPGSLGLLAGGPLVVSILCTCYRCITPTGGDHVRLAVHPWLKSRDAFRRKPKQFPGEDC